MTDDDRDKLYDVVWSGDEGLIGDRDSKPNIIFNPTKRNYTFTGKYIGLYRPPKSKAEPQEPKIDTFGDGEED